MMDNNRIILDYLLQLQVQYKYSTWEGRCPYIVSMEEKERERERRAKNGNSIPIDKSLHDPIWIIEEQKLHMEWVFRPAFFLPW